MKIKSEKKKLSSTWFLKSKEIYKKEKKKYINHSTDHNLNTKYYLKYL